MCINNKNRSLKIRDKTRVKKSVLPVVPQLRSFFMYVSLYLKRPEATSETSSSQEYLIVAINLNITCLKNKFAPLEQKDKQS